MRCEKDGEAPNILLFLLLFQLDGDFHDQTVVGQGNDFPARHSKLVDDLDRHLPHLHDHVLDGAGDQLAFDHRLAGELLVDVSPVRIHGSRHVLHAVGFADDFEHFQRVGQDVS